MSLNDEHSQDDTLEVIWHSIKPPMKCKFDKLETELSEAKEACNILRTELNQQNN